MDLVCFFIVATCFYETIYSGTGFGGGFSDLFGLYGADRKTSVYIFMDGSVALGYSTSSGFDASWGIGGRTFRGMAVPMKSGVLYDFYSYSDMATEAEHAMILVTPFTISYVWDRYVYDEMSNTYNLRFLLVKRE